MKTSSTADIVSAGRYHEGAENFSALFNNAWPRVAHTVLKLETRQEYREPGNPSWEKLAAGEFDEAIRLIPDSKKKSEALYQSLAKKKVAFVRGRPVVLPLTHYLRWEIAAYDWNADHGEEILFAHSEAVSDMLQESLQHDFMVFDEFVAVIHDYDERGELRGGWEILDASHIAMLSKMFNTFRKECVPYKKFLEKHKRGL
jgi:hypothetical protein